MSICVLSVHMRAGALQNPGEDTGRTGAGVTGGCKLPSVGAGTEPRF